MSINRVIISGNLTRDPELRSTAGGTSVLGFGVAVNDRRKNQQTGEWEDGETLWLSFSLWGKKAEALADAAKKGDLVLVAGTLTQRSFDGKHGEQRTVIEVKATEVAIVPRIQSGAGWSKDRTAAADPWQQPATNNEPPF